MHVTFSRLVGCYWRPKTTFPQKDYFSSKDPKDSSPKKIPILRKLYFSLKLFLIFYIVFEV